MFGKKKSVDSAAPAPSGPSKSKSKKSSTKIKRVTAKAAPNVFVQHFEKMLLGLIVGLAGFLFYRSLSTETLPSNRTPEALSRQAQELLTKVKTENHWDQILPNVQQYTRHQFHTDSKAARTPVEATDYAMGRLEPPTVRELYGKRSDPELFAPIEVHVRHVFGALATSEKMTDANRKDPYEQYVDAPAPGKKAVRPKPNRNPRPGEEVVEQTTPTNVRVLKAEYDLGVQIQSGLGAGAIDSDGMGRMSGGMSGRSGASFGSSNPTGEGGLNDNAGPSYRLGSRPVSFNVITGLIPHAKQVEEFQRAIYSSGTYLAGRDYPTYLTFEIQRADVTNAKNQEIPEEQWKTIIRGIDMRDLPIKLKWATRNAEGNLAPPIPEVIDPRAFLPGLTAPIPPLLIRDYRDIAKHPKIDWIWNPRVVRSVGQRPKKTQADEDNEFVAGADNASLGGGFSGEGSAGFGSGSGMASGMSDYGNRATDGGEGSSGMRLSGGGEGMSGYGGEGFGSETGVQPTEFKMVRAYDFLDNGSRGKKLRYRIRIAMRDPNYPENQDYADQTENRNRPPYFPAPTPDQLEGEVLERIAAQRQKDDKEIEIAKKENKFKPRSPRYTPWSQPSPTVFVTQPVEFFIGDIDTKGVKAVVTQLVANPPSVVLAAEQEGLLRGAVLGGLRGDRDFVVPTTKVVKRVEAAVAPGVLLIDHRGGTPLAGDRKDDPMSTAVEAMAIRSDGSIIFSNSLDDQMLYRMYSFKDDKEAAEAASSSEAASPNPGNPGR